MTGLLEIVPAKPLEVSPYGLLSLRDPEVTDNERWMSGFTYESLACTATVDIVDICGNYTAATVITPNNDDRNLNYEPFGIRAFDQCSTIGYEKHNVQQRVIDALEACTQKALEYEFWTGSIARANNYVSNRYLASPASTDVTPGGGGPVKVRWGLAVLERALAECGCGTRGTIHVTSDVASVLPVKENNGHLETQIGNYIVAGSGYDGSGPDGTMPGSGTWMYATGPVTVMLSRTAAVGTSMAQQVDTKVNTWEAYAERGASVRWDGCCAFAVHVDLSLDYM